MRKNDASNWIINYKNSDNGLAKFETLFEYS